MTIKSAIVKKVVQGSTFYILNKVYKNVQACRLVLNLFKCAVKCRSAYVFLMADPHQFNCSLSDTN